MKIMILFVAEPLDETTFSEVYTLLKKAAYECNEPCTSIVIDGVGENKLQIEEI